MAEFDAEALARTHRLGRVVRIHDGKTIEGVSGPVIAALKSAHAAGRAEGLRRAAEIAERFSGPQLAALIESELEATNGK